MRITSEIIENTLDHYGFNELACVVEHPNSISISFRVDDADMSTIYSISGIVQDIINALYWKDRFDLYDAPSVLFNEDEVYVTFQNKIFEVYEK